MEIKRVIVVRKLYDDGHGGLKKIRRGKEIAQGSHSTDQYWIDLLSKSKKLDKEDKQWLLHGQKTVACQVNTEEELTQLHQAAKAAGLKCYMQIDSGRTEFNGEKTPTVIAIGPNNSEDIDKITGNLKLY